MQIQNRDEERLPYISKYLAAIDWNLALLVKRARCVLDRLLLPQDPLALFAIKARLQCVYPQTCRIIALQREAVRHVAAASLAEDRRSPARCP